MQQQNGYLWVGTENGVTRFDGKQFLHYRYDPGKRHHISNNMIIGIAEDRSGNVWLATEDGLNRVSADGSVTLYTARENAKDGLRSSWLMSLFSDSKGDIWIGSASGLSRYDPTNDSFRHYLPYDVNSGDDIDAGVFSIQEAADGTLYLGTTHGVLYLAPSADSLKPLKVADPNAQAIIGAHSELVYLTSRGDLLVAVDDHGVLSIAVDSGQVRPFIQSGNTEWLDPKYAATSIIEQADGSFWIASDKGIAITSAEGQVTRVLKNDVWNSFSLPGDYVYWLMKGDAGLTWIGTDNGLAYYSSLREASILHQNHVDGSGLLNRVANSVLAAGNGSAWVASEDGLSRLEPATGEVRQYPYIRNEPNNQYWQIATADDENYWLASSEGLALLDSRNGLLQQFSNAEDAPHGLPSSELYTVLPDKQGGVWFTGYFNVGLGYFHPEKGTLKRYLHEDGSRYYEEGNFTYRKIWGSDGSIWMGTSDGVFRVQIENGETYHYPIGSEHAYIRVVDLALDASGHLWIATQGRGLVKISVDDANPEVANLDYVTGRTGASENQFNNLIIDSVDPDIIWLTSNNRLYRYQISDEKLLSFPGLIEKRNLAFRDASITQSASTLFVASNNGVYQFDKAKIRQNSFEPNIEITGILINGRTSPESLSGRDRLLSLPFEENDITIEFAALDFTAPENNRYRYQLVGVDKNWVESFGKNYVSYSNLDAGNYRFLVEGSNSDGIWSRHQAEFIFQIRPAWWYWAIWVLSGCLLATLAYYLFSRHKRIRLLSDLAYTDSLTSLANRRHLVDMLDRLLSSEQPECALIFIDLDEFKQINDSFGHETGDHYIKAISQRLQSTMRETDLLARLGGDEFAVLARGKLSRRQAEQMSTRLLEQLSSPVVLHGKAMKCSASLGVASYPQDGKDSSTLLRNADTAMYAAKNKGKNTYCFFGEASSQSLRQHFTLGSQILTALERRQIVPFFQSKVCCRSGKILGAEALARWQHPEMGMIPPFEFIQIAEANGAILEVGKSILKQACHQASIWRKQGIFDGTMSVNVSPVELKDPGYIDSLKQIITDCRLPPGALELEITESLLMEDMRLAESILARLKAIGVKVALDDFGTGYSSLSYLGGLSIDTLKIDRSFTKEITGAKKKRKVLKAILRLAQDLELNVVAEGVETNEQLKFLEKIACDEAQGYLFCKPQDMQQFAKTLASASQNQPAKSPALIG